MSSIPTGSFVRDRFEPVTAPDFTIVSTSPADLDDRLGEFPCSIVSVDKALLAARESQPAWDALGLDGRIAHLRRLRAVIASHEERIARVISREMGKVLREGRAEAKAMAAKIDIAIDEGLAFTRDFALENGRLACRYRPHGVMAVLGPFNFPLHLPHGHIVPALLAGNTVVFKPSEVTPACGALYAQLMAEADLPAGVFNMVQGDGRVGARLTTTEGIDGVLFTGSYGVGTQILRANASRPGRMIALELGGKNAALVHDDAPFEKALLDVLLSAFSTAGQRCTCVSRLIVTRGVADRFVLALAERTSRIRVGHPLDAGVFMGPLASPPAFEKFAQAQRDADAEDSECVVDPVDPIVMHEGRAMRGCYVAPRVRRVLERSASSKYQHEEIFGPDLAVYVADDLDHAIALANDTPYGLAGGVWTSSETVFEECARRLRVGCVTWNAPTVGSSSRLPFGGLGHSGNHRAAGVFSSLYCAWPLAVTKGDASVDVKTVPPGISLDAK